MAAMKRATVLGDAGNALWFVASHHVEKRRQSEAYAFIVFAALEFWANSAARFSRSQMERSFAEEGEDSIVSVIESALQCKVSDNLSLLDSFHSQCARNVKSAKN